MSNNSSQNHASDSAGGIDVNVDGFIDVNSPLVGRSILDGLRRRFSTNDQMKEGDYLMDRSRNMLRKHLQLIEVDDQDTIRRSIDELVSITYMPQSVG